MPSRIGRRRVSLHGYGGDSAWHIDCVPGPETRAYRLESGCAEGINIEPWICEGSSHAPGYGDDFADALVGWLLQK